MRTLQVGLRHRSSTFPDLFVRPKSRTVMRMAGSPRARLTSSPGWLLSIDLECEQVAESDGAVHSFSAAPFFGRSCLLSCLDASLCMAALVTSPIRSFQFYRSRRYCGSASAARMLPRRVRAPVRKTLAAGYRTRDLATSSDTPIGAEIMGAWSYALCLDAVVELSRR